MWTQIKETILSSYTPAGLGSDVTLASTPSTLGINVGMWLIVEPYSSQCQIRRIVSINSGAGTVNVVPALTTGWHSSGDKVYIQTSPNWDITLFGADALKTATQNTESINAAITDCYQCGGGIVSIPKGKYLVERDGSNDWCLNVNNVTNIKFLGEGIGVSSIERENNSDVSPLRVFSVINSVNIEWHELNIEGTGSPTDDFVGDSECIYLELTDTILISKVNITMSRYNGVTIKESNYVRIENCIINQCLNYGISAIYPDCNNIEIQSNVFFDNHYQDIDFENNHSHTISNVLIENNSMRRNSSYIETLLSIAGFSHTCFYNAIEIINNKFFDGYITIEQCLNSIFSNNLITSGVYTLPVTVNKRTKNFNFENNVIVNNTGGDWAIKFDCYLDDDGGLATENVIVNANDFQTGGCQFFNVKNLSYTANKVHKDTPLYKGFSYNIDNVPSYGFGNLGELTITDNQFINSSFCGLEVVQGTMSDDNKLDIMIIANNVIQGQDLSFGILIASTADPFEDYVFWNRAIIATSNISSATTTPGNEISVCGSYQIEENPHQQTWISKGFPEGKILAPQGSVAIDNTIEADNNYSKNTIAGSIGWDLFSEMDKQLLFKENFTLQGSSGYKLTHQTSALPNINVFTTTPNTTTPWNFPTSITDSWIIVSPGEGITNGSLTNPNLAFIDADPVRNGILKATFLDTNIGIAGEGAGLIFRFSSDGDYWSFYFNNTTTVGVYELHLEKIVGGSLTTFPISGSFLLGQSRRLVLQVIIEDDFISVFYNDLLILTVYDTDLNDNTKFGLYGLGSANIFNCQSFKLLIP